MKNEENIRSEKEIRERLIELHKEMGYRYTKGTKELIQTKIDTLEWVLKRRDCF